MEPQAPESAPDSRRFHRKKRFRLPVLFIPALIVFAVAIVVRLLTGVMNQGQARDNSADEWRAVYTEDVASFQLWSEQLEESVNALERIAAETPADISQPLTPEQTGAVRHHWARVFDLSRALDRRADYHRDFVVWLRKDRRADHVRGFLLCDVGDLLVQDAGLRLADALGGQKRWEIILNEPHGGFGIPEGGFDQFKSDLVTPRRAARQLAARQYLHVLELTGEYTDATSDADGQWLAARAGSLHERVRSRLLTRGIDINVTELKDEAGDAIFEKWFPIQKTTANAMGNIRIKRPGVYLITLEQLAEARHKLEPGDIAISRKNWYASNAGIPGYWPHAMLYIGTPLQMEEYFDDPGVVAWCKTQGAESYPELLAGRYPEYWAVYTKGKMLDIPASHDEEDDKVEKVHFDHAVIESIAMGVSLHPLEESMRVDSVAAMRPRLPRIEKARAIERAFSHLGKPYDYNFDFLSDQALVCSELVYKSYQSGETMKGVEIPLENMMGRPALAPTTIVRMFDLEYGTPDQQLDFVLFLDAREEAGVAAWETMESFRRSWMRPKWSALND